MGCVGVVIQEYKMKPTVMSTCLFLVELDEKIDIYDRPISDIYVLDYFLGTRGTKSSDVAKKSLELEFLCHCESCSPHLVTFILFV